MQKYINLLLGMVLLTSCSGRSITKADITSIWLPDKASQKLIRSGSKCQLEFQNDGSVLITGIPDSFIKPPNQATGAIFSGKGQWSLAQKNGSTRVSLILSEVNGQPIHYQSNEIIAESRNRKVFLFYYSGGEGGERFVFEQAEGAVKAQNYHK